MTTPRLFARVRDYCLSMGLERDFEDFARAHAHIFEAALDMKDGDEHPMEFHRLYREYLETFERKIEDCIEREGGTIEDFKEECRLILEDQDESCSDRFFIEALLATTEYNVFLSLMKGEARMQARSTGK